MACPLRQIAKILGDPPLGAVPEENTYASHKLLICRCTMSHAKMPIFSFRATATPLDDITSQSAVLTRELSICACSTIRSSSCAPLQHPTLIQGQRRARALADFLLRKDKGNRAIAGEASNAKEFNTGKPGQKVRKPRSTEMCDCGVGNHTKRNHVPCMKAREKTLGKRREEDLVQGHAG